MVEERSGSSGGRESQRGERVTGQGDHVVRRGECISSIAEARGLFWESVWNDPENDELREVRGDPNVLRPGDRVHVRERREREEEGAAGERHRFRRRGVPALLRLRLLDHRREPLANVAYSIEIDGSIRSGETDGDGHLSESILPDAERACLRYHDGEREFRWELPLGSLDPADTLAGCRQRLGNLGFPCGSGDGGIDDTTQAAVRAFQRAQGLEETGEIDDETQQSIAESHGS